MKKIFEDENGFIVHQTEDAIYIPAKGTSIWLKDRMFVVMYLYIDYDENIIEIHLERE